MSGETLITFLTSIMFLTSIYQNTGQHIGDIAISINRM